MRALKENDWPMAMEMKSWLESYGFTVVPPEFEKKEFGRESVPKTIEKKGENRRRCERCQSWKHKTSQCQEETYLCSVCGGPHYSRQCRIARKKEEKVTYGCANCKVVGHSAASMFCPFRPPQLSKIVHENRVQVETESLL